MGALQCWVAAESDTSFTIFDLSSLKKKLLICFPMRCIVSFIALNTQEW